MEALITFRDRFHLPFGDEAAAELRFFRFPDDSPEALYLRARREALGGPLPARRRTAAKTPPVPALETYAQFALNPAGKEMSTTMAFVRMLGGLLKDKELGRRIVPIVADEARTFGMANLFRQIGIYAPSGQLYEPEDASSMLSYRESRDGQLLEEGISEAGALSSWIAAATAYSVHGQPMLPFYIYYSMFGFQRVGDLIWAAADQRSRGFLIGATAGRTTLGGEGLQHQDGSSHVMAAAVPNCRAYDPAFAGELAVILDHGMRRMMSEQVDEFYYITVMNENYPQADLRPGDADAIVKGMYRHSGEGEAETQLRVRLLGSGAIFREVQAAAALIARDFGVASDLFSVTSYSELARDAQEAERLARLFPDEPPRLSHVAACLSGDAPVIAASDYVRAVPQLIAPHLRARCVVLGTDGFGRSDARAALRKFFEVDRNAIALAAIFALVQDGQLPPQAHRDACARYGAGAERAAPWTR